MAVVGHGGSGKTQLVSAVLFDAGMVNRLGKVDEGNTVTDYDEEEIARKHTLSASLAYAEWNKTKINLIDTPGFGNFFADARAAMRVVECALVVVDARRRRRGPDREGLGRGRRARAAAPGRRQPARSRPLVARAHARVGPADVGRSVIPIQLPIGEERDFTRRRRPVAMKAYMFAADGSGKMTEGAVPAAMADAANAARDALIEMVAEADEPLMEKFFEAGTLTQDELVKGLASATRGRKNLPADVHLGPAQHRRATDARRDALLRAVPRRSPVHGARRRRDGRADRGRQSARTPPSSGRPWPTNSPAASRCSASSRGR